VHHVHQSRERPAFAKASAGLAGVRPSAWRTAADAGPRDPARETHMTNFFVYMVGVILFVGALAYGASLLGLSTTWIAVIAVAVLGIGVMGAIVKTRQKEPS
jgi:hypothetical protein